MSEKFASGTINPKQTNKQTNIPSLYIHVYLFHCPLSAIGLHDLFLSDLFSKKWSWKSDAVGYTRMYVTIPIMMSFCTSCVGLQIKNPITFFKNRIACICIHLPNSKANRRASTSYIRYILHNFEIDCTYDSGMVQSICEQFTNKVKR